MKKGLIGDDQHADIQHGVDNNNIEILQSLIPDLENGYKHVKSPELESLIRHLKTLTLD